MSRSRGPALSVLLAVLAFPVAPSSAQSRGKEIPFPTQKTTILRREKVVYVVKGRMKIPRGVEITCLRDVYVVGRGKDATIEVHGRLKVHGVEDREVIFENVTIELAREFEDVQIDQAFFRDEAKIRTPEGTSVKGKLFLELVDFRDESNLEITFHHGSIDLRATCSDALTIIRAVPPPEEEENKVRVMLLGCAESPMDPTKHPGLIGGLVLEGIHDATVRINRPMALS